MANDLTISTNAPAGYTLQLSGTETDTALQSTNGSIPAHSGTVANPTALPVNRWGFRVNGQGGFGAGSDAPENASSSAYSWAGVPPIGSPVSIHATSEPGEHNVTVWYGMVPEST